MKKVVEKDLLEILKAKFPESIRYWKEYLEDEEFQGMTVSALTNFAYYAIDLIQKNDCDETKKLFDYMEYLLLHGDQGVQDAVATGFLEALDNASFKDEKVKKALALLGEESKAYLKAWDDFWKDKK